VADLLIFSEISSAIFCEIALQILGSGDEENDKMRGTFSDATNTCLQ